MILQGLRKLIDQFRITSPNSMLRETTTENPVFFQDSSNRRYKRDYPYGHADEAGPFLRTAISDDNDIEPHLDALVEATMANMDERYVLSKPEVREGYMNVLFHAHKPLEPRVYEVLQRAVQVARPFSCISALNRTLAVHNVSGKSLGEVRAIVETVAAEYSVPKKGDL